MWTNHTKTAKTINLPQHQSEYFPILGTSSRFCSTVPTESLCHLCQSEKDERWMTVSIMQAIHLYVIRVRLRVLVCEKIAPCALPHGYGSCTDTCKWMMPCTFLMCTFLCIKKPMAISCRFSSVFRVIQRQTSVGLTAYFKT